MKIIITENKFKDTIKLSLKELGTESIINYVGGWENFCKVMNIEGPMDFLHLFDDLEQVQSEDERDFTLFRYKKGRNIMVYDRDNKTVYLNFSDIWLPLDELFDLTYPVIKGITKKWLGDVYNLKGITTSNGIQYAMKLN